MVETTSKDLVDFAMAKDAMQFTNAVNNLLAAKARAAVEGSVVKTASQMFKQGYFPKAGDEQEFVDQHTIAVTDYPVQNKNDAPFATDLEKADHDGRPNSGDEEEVKKEHKQIAAAIATRIFERKLTKPEMKKREEVAQAMERDNPSMPMGKKMAIATAVAKKSA